jgi:uncharacterized protein (DUF1800 family)
VSGRGPSRLRVALLVATVASFVPWGAAPSPARAAEEDAAAAAARARHVVRRCTFGARPGDVEAVVAAGIERWIERQLDPSSIPDEAMEERLAPLLHLKRTSAQTLQAIRDEVERATQGARDENERQLRAQAAYNRAAAQPSAETRRAVLLRAVHSERMLFEVLVDFWRNHFNVDVSKDDVRLYVADWEREVLRRHALGRFEDLLLATARHPAMLFYLDNHVSRAPAARGERVLAGREREDRTDGLNENYARELMELHTVGVDNGYDQEDVVQLALVLTGWSIDRETGTFAFHESWHARGRKRVMGKIVKGGGAEDGEAVVLHLARHANTRAFVCTKLVRHFVADEPPADVVAAAVAAWTRSKGDLREVMRAILLHPRFFAPEHMRTKAKTPFEFVVSLVRATGVDVKEPEGLLERLADMQQPLYQCEDPTGWSDRAVDWMDPGVLAVRWQLARDVLDGKVAGVDAATAPLWTVAQERPEVWEYPLVERLLAGEPAGALTMAPFRQRITALRRKRDPTPPERRAALATLATLLLGSPEFQRQ